MTEVVVIFLVEASEDESKDTDAVGDGMTVVPAGEAEVMDCEKQY